MDTTTLPQKRFKLKISKIKFSSRMMMARKNDQNPKEAKRGADGKIHEYSTQFKLNHK